MEFHSISTISIRCDVFVIIIIIIINIYDSMKRSRSWKTEKETQQNHTQRQRERDSIESIASPATIFRFVQYEKKKKTKQNCKIDWAFKCDPHSIRYNSALLTLWVLWAREKCQGSERLCEGRRADEWTNDRSIAMCVVLNATVMRFCTLLWWCPSAQSTISSIYKLRCNFCCKWLKRHLLGWHFFRLHFVVAFIFLHFTLVLIIHTIPGGKSVDVKFNSTRNVQLCWILLLLLMFLSSLSLLLFSLSTAFFLFILNSVFICCRCDLIRWFEGKKFHEIYIYISYEQRSADFTRFIQVRTMCFVQIKCANELLIHAHFVLCVMRWFLLLSSLFSPFPIYFLQHLTLLFTIRTVYYGRALCCCCCNCFFFSLVSFIEKNINGKKRARGKEISIYRGFVISRRSFCWMLCVCVCFFPSLLLRFFFIFRIQSVLLLGTYSGIGMEQHACTTRYLMKFKWTWSMLIIRVLGISNSFFRCYDIQRTAYIFLALSYVSLKFQLSCFASMELMSSDHSNNEIVFSSSSLSSQLFCSLYHDESYLNYSQGLLNKTVDRLLIRFIRKRSPFCK